MIKNYKLYLEQNFPELSPNDIDNMIGMLRELIEE